MQLFTSKDFKVFEIADFHERMAAIAASVRPKLTSIGQSLGPSLSGFIDQPLHVHVARHARRTVNPPDDTWAAFGRNRRGYKMDVHFKLAISRHCIRMLCEVGPEYAAKSEWLLAWNREFRGISKALRGTSGLAWFKNEHDEEPAAALKDLETSELKTLPEMLASRRDGQFVLGQRISAADFVKLQPKQWEKIASDTYKPLAALFRIP